MEDVTKMEGYDENSFHKGFENGHEHGYMEGVKIGQIQAVSEMMSALSNTLAYLTQQQQNESVE